jgi:hypothetical protein
MLVPTILIQFGIVVCITAYASIYISGIIRGTVKPVLATWLFLSVATVLSFVTNFSESGMRGMFANAYNIVDSIATVAIFIAVLFANNLRKTFTTFEKACLGSVFLVFIAWLVSGQNILAHLCLQGILVIAYLPTLVYLWNAHESTESITTWSLNALAAMFGIVEPIQTRALLPIVYGVRSILSCIAVVALTIRLQMRKNRLSSALIQ